MIDSVMYSQICILYNGKFIPLIFNCKNFNNLMLAFYTINLPQKCEVGFSALVIGDVYALGCYITKCAGDSTIKA